MNTIKKHPKYIEWLNAEDMHKDSRCWLSELEFIKDEQLFFNDVITSYTPQLTGVKYYDKSKKLVSELIDLEKQADLLINLILTHERHLKVMVDAIDQPIEEDVYKETHRKLIVDVNEFMWSYRNLKTRLFNLIKTILRQEKRLLK